MITKITSEPENYTMVKPKNMMLPVINPSSATKLLQNKNDEMNKIFDDHIEKILEGDQPIKN